MGHRVLVTFATKYGATAEIARAIGEVLREHSLSTDIMPVKQVKDLAPYTAVVLGSAVYMGRWRKEAARFLEDNEAMLAQRDVWIFSSGPTSEGDAQELLDGWRLPEGQRAAVERIKPHAITVFHGVLDVEKLNVFERTIIKNVNAPTGDFRNWETITDWATAVATTLAEETT